MSQSVSLVLLFVVSIACLPWLVRRYQARSEAGAHTAAASKVLSAVAVGPQQRVVTVQVGTGPNAQILVLGVTSTSISCLHKWDGVAAGSLQVGDSNNVQPSPERAA